jgi:hypothetical protein
MWNTKWLFTEHNFIQRQGLKALLIYACICLSFIPCALPHPVEGKDKVNQVDSRYRVQLTTTIKDQRYCSGTLRLALRLNFKNTSEMPIIISRHFLAVYRYLVGRDYKSIVARKYEQDISAMIHPIPINEIDSPIPDDTFFVILKPGEVHAVDDIAYFTVYNKMEGREGLRSGNHVLQVRVGTWFQNIELANKLRDQWKAKGFLWTSDILSQPMNFQVEENFQATNCK